jgi:hypothetical protein
LVLRVESSEKEVWDRVAYFIIFNKQIYKNPRMDRFIHGISIYGKTEG